MIYEPLTNPSREHIIHNVLWVVDLTDGRRVYQNDTQENSSWLDLKRYLYNNRYSGLFIQQMFLQFRDNFQHIARDVDAYFFSKKLLGQFGTDNTRDLYVAGFTKDGKNLLTKHFFTPDLLLDETETRDLETKLYNRGLIVHPDYLVNFPYNEYFDE